MDWPKGLIFWRKTQNNQHEELGFLGLNDQLGHDIANKIRHLLNPEDQLALRSASRQERAKAPQLTLIIKRLSGKQGKKGLKSFLSKMAERKSGVLPPYVKGVKLSKKILYFHNGDYIDNRFPRNLWKILAVNPQVHWQLPLLWKANINKIEKLNLDFENGHYKFKVYPNASEIKKPKMVVDFAQKFTQSVIYLDNRRAYRDDNLNVKDYLNALIAIGHQHYGVVPITINDFTIDDLLIYFDSIEGLTISILSLEEILFTSAEMDKLIGFFKRHPNLGLKTVRLPRPVNREYWLQIQDAIHDNSSLRIDKFQLREIPNSDDSEFSGEI